MSLNPPNLFGVSVPLNLVVARTDDVAIALSSAVVYPNGVELALVGRRRTVGPPPLLLSSVVDDEDEEPEGSELRAHALSFGIEFADGRTAATPRLPSRTDGPSREQSVLLLERGGRGTNLTWQTDYWISPLPPPGPLAFTCEWTAEGIASRVEVAADPLLEAARRVTPLWDNE